MYYQSFYQITKPSLIKIDFIRAEDKIEMVFYYQNCSDQPIVRNKCPSDLEKLLKFQAE